MHPDDLSIDQEIQVIRRHWEAIRDSIERLSVRAYNQDYAEKHSNALGMLAYEGMAFVGQTQKGDVIDDQWIELRDSLIHRARRLLSDFESTNKVFDDLIFHGTEL